MDWLYRVSFFKKLIGGNGYEADAVQGVVEVHASSEGGAIEVATLLFGRRAGVRVWSLRADRAVAEVLSHRKSAVPADQGSTGVGSRAVRGHDHGALCRWPGDRLAAQGDVRRFLGATSKTI
jgi:hypothetical protein